MEINEIITFNSSINQFHLEIIKQYTWSYKNLFLKFTRLTLYWPYFIWWFGTEAILKWFIKNKCLDRMLSKRENYPVSNNLEDNEQKIRVTINHETEVVIRKKEMEPRKVVVHLEEPPNIFSLPSRESRVWTKLFYQRKQSRWISAYSAFSHFIFWNIHQGKHKLHKS